MGLLVALALVPTGKFMMGCPHGESGGSSAEIPQHGVVITKPFYMGLYHVTRAQFAAFVADSNYTTDAEKDGWAYGWDGNQVNRVEGASWRKPGFEQTDEHPVVSVSHSDAVAFRKWLSKKTKGRVRLPTEAEWEHACRAGTDSAYLWGNVRDGGEGWANVEDQTFNKQFPNRWCVGWDDGYVFASPVGKFRANGFGLHDMLGNAGEWCANWWEDDYSHAETTDPQGPESGTFRVLRGGCWRSDAWDCRCACRNGDTPDCRTNALGFRVVVEIEMGDIEEGRP